MTLRVALIVIALLLSACITRESRSLVGPSPVILPDAATIAVGDAQTFVVMHADVVRFDVSADQGKWSDCVAVDETVAESDRIRIVALHRCRGLVYVVANLGSGRSPVAAMLKVQ